jgi:outer membrane protein assembly factor BamB
MISPIHQELTMLRFVVPVCLLASTAGAAPVSRPSADSIPLPLGAAAPDGKVGFFANASGGIDAVQLANGELLWETKEATRPLAVWAGKVVAEAPVAGKANALQIVLLDAESGKRLRISDPVVFPEWVSIGLTHGRSFTSWARMDRDTLLLSWEARAFYAGGVPPTPQIIERAKKQASGLAKIDCTSGKIEMATLPPAPAGRPDVPEELREVKSQQYWTGREWKTAPLVVGNIVSALEVQSKGGMEAVLRLKRWDRASARELDTVELLRGKALWPQVSLDRRHLFVHQALVKEQLPPGDYAWWAFDLQTGKQIAKVPFEPGMTDMAVVDGKLLYLSTASTRGPRRFDLSERKVHAVDLASGKELWQRAVEPQRLLLPLP